MAALRIPSATYRIQFSLNFRFTDARDLVPYLHELGITDLYASPRSKARKGSSHGYDVADPQRINSELGTEQEFEELVEKLNNYSMGLLLDIVPNHMAASWENPWWRDVLENGPSSPFAHFFDIDWRPPITKASFLQENKLLLPILGNLYGRVLDNQEIVLRLDEKGFYVQYYDWKLPLDPKTYMTILEHCQESWSQSTAADQPALQPLQDILERIDRLPSRESKDIAERQAQKDEIKQGVWRLFQESSDFRNALDATFRFFNGTRGVPESFDRLDQLLGNQAYRLAFWKIAAEEINYRRFFDVSDLVGLRIELPEVFEAKEKPILKLIEEGKVTGLRVDHIDGLYDPLVYLERLQSSAAAGEADDQESKRIYVIVEKILGENERLPESWPVFGTTGYSFLNSVNGVFIHPRGMEALEAIYAAFTGDSRPFAEVSYSAKKLVMEQLFAGEVASLAHHLARLAALDRYARDVPLPELTQALVEVTARLPIYRIYIRSLDVPPRERAYLERTLEIARQETLAGRPNGAAFDFLRRVLLLEPPLAGEDIREGSLQFVMRWQQFTGVVMAKGLEDTAFYAHNSFVSLNEVGGDFTRRDPPADAEAFHLFNKERLAFWPAALNATSTHDTKRSEDVRARIDVLSEIPDAWGVRLRRWSRWNQAKKRIIRGSLVPTPNEEEYLYQTMLGAWPLEEEEIPGFTGRLVGCTIKAAREAKTNTNWISPNQEHESALQTFIELILNTSEKNRFLADFLEFQKTIAFYGAWNSLAQLLLKITSPGVPDFYQGTELWDLSMVDPDNRRPVDFRKREKIVDELKASEHRDSSLAAELVEHWPDGRIKFHVTRKALNFRRDHKELFLKGEYIPLRAVGKNKDNLCAFVRRKARDWVIAAVPRLITELVEPGTPPIGAQAWSGGAVELPANAPASWENMFTGEVLKTSSSKKQKTFPPSALFRSFPVALLFGTNE